MAHHLFISIFIALTFNEISTQFINFKLALINDIRDPCIHRKGYSPYSAAAIYDDCIEAAMGNLNNASIEAVISLMCTTDTIKDCYGSFKDVVLSCLSEKADETVDQVIEMELKKIAAFCKNDAEYYRVLADKTSCDKYIEVSSMMIECQIPVEYHAASGHLATLFNKKNCKKYNVYNECLKAIDVGCFAHEEAFKRSFDAFYRASPCVNFLN